MSVGFWSGFGPREEPTLTRPERNLIVLTFHYPPDGFVGGLRWSGLTRYLAPLGWHSRVVTAADGNGSPVPGVTVDRVPRRATLHDAYRRARTHTSHQNGGPAATEPGAGVDVAPRRWIQRLRMEAGQALAVPDEARGWLYGAWHRARRLVRELQPEVLVTSGPPHSVHVAGWLATRGTPTRWVADFRDPWAGPVSDAWLHMPHYRSRLARYVRRAMERTVVRRADDVICNTREMGMFLARRYPGLDPLWLPNGVDIASLPSGPRDRFREFTVAYVGTLYGGRELGSVLEGFSLFLETAPPEVRAGAALRIAGHVDSDALARVLDGARERGLSDRVQYLGVLPRSEALVLAARSHLAVVLAQKQEVQVPAKLYELVAMGVPAVVVGPASGAAAVEATRLGAYAVPEDDAEGMARVMRAAWSGETGGRAAGAPGLDYRDLAVAADEMLRGAGHLLR